MSEDEHVVLIIAVILGVVIVLAIGRYLWITGVPT